MTIDIGGNEVSQVWSVVFMMENEVKELKKIIVCGINGAGKSTLGKSLAEALGYKFLDIEDYYFPVKDTDYIYADSRTKEEVGSMLLEDMRQYDNIVLSAVKGNYGDEIESMFTCAVFIEIPQNVSIERVWNRSYQKFGNRILEGGDLHEKEKEFFDMVKNRSALSVEDWLKFINIPVIRVDGTKSVVSNVGIIIKRLNS